MSHDHEVEVQFTSMKTNRKAKFKAADTQTLQQVWESSYAKFVPPEQKASDDKVQCEGGADLSQYLGLTLAALHDQHVCQNRHFQIVGSTGGAIGISH